MTALFVCAGNAEIGLYSYVFVCYMASGFRRHIKAEKIKTVILFNLLPQANQLGQYVCILLKVHTLQAYIARFQNS